MDSNDADINLNLPRSASSDVFDVGASRPESPWGPRELNRRARSPWGPRWLNCPANVSTTLDIQNRASDLRERTPDPIPIRVVSELARQAAKSKIKKKRRNSYVRDDSPCDANKSAMQRSEEPARISAERSGRPRSKESKERHRRKGSKESSGNRRGRQEKETPDNAERIESRCTSRCTSKSTETEMHACGSGDEDVIQRRTSRSSGDTERSVTIKSKRRGEERSNLVRRVPTGHIQDVSRYMSPEEWHELQVVQGYVTLGEMRSGSADFQELKPLAQQLSLMSEKQKTRRSLESC